MELTKQKKQIGMLYVTTLAGVALGVLSSIVNTRFLLPADYGDVRYVQNIINFIAVFLLFGYFLSGARMMALSQDERYDRKVKGCMVLVLAVACLILAACMPVCYFLHQNKPTVAFLFLVSLPVCLCPLLMNYIDQTMQGDNQIGRLSLARILPYLFYVPIGYFVYKTFGATSTSMMLLQWGIYSAVYLGIIISTKPIFRDIKSVWRELQKENRSYGIQLYIGSLVMVASNYIAGISLGYFNHDNSEVGFYTLALTVTAPLAYLPTIVGTTYFKRFASQAFIPRKVVYSTLLMTAVTCVLFLLVIQHLVVFLYSEKYAVVGTYASWLSVGFCIHGMGDMYNRFLCSHGQGVSVRNASIVNGVLKMIGFVVLVALFNTTGAIITVLCCDTVYFACIYYYYMKFTKEAANG